MSNPPSDAILASPSARGARPRPHRDRPLRLALATGSYNLIADGVALTLNRLVAYLERHGVEVLVFAPAGDQAFAGEGAMVPVASVALPLRPEYRLALGLPARQRARLEAFAPDVIHVATPDLLGHEVIRLAERLGCPLVGSYHARYETYLKHYGAGFLAPAAARRIGAFYERCREVYVPSPSMAEALKAVSSCDIRLWPRGVDSLRFQPGRRSTAWRRAHGFGDEEVVVAFVGRLVREKRTATVVRAMKLLEARGRPYRTLIVGDGPEGDALAAQLPGATFTGFLDGDALATAYASSDIFFFPSDTETFGAVTLEAMASGLPTVCARATGSRSLVIPEVTGFLEDAADPAAFAERIDQLAQDAEMRRRMGLAARVRSLAFSWDEAMAIPLRRYEALATAA